MKDNAGQQRKYPCVCCGHLTISEPPGSYEICSICSWEDDIVQLRWPTMRGGANAESLIEAQKHYRDLATRPPGDDEILEPGWRPLDEQRDRFEPLDSSPRAQWPEDATVLYWWRPTYWRLSEAVDPQHDERAPRRLPTGAAPATEDLLAVYRDYLACLNARRWDDLERFVADDVVYNGEPVGLRGYRAMLEADVDAIPDLRFVPEILLADERVVSCRLFFECTPRRTFLGFEPTGRRISFAEHVFYAFSDGRIVEVWSQIDREAVRRQLS